MMINTVFQNEELDPVSVRYQPSPPYRILVVEDDPEIRRLNARVLKDSGHEVDTANDGMTGWYAIHAAHLQPPGSYDLLITDNNMPGLTGLELIKRLRSAHMALPVIMASGMFPTKTLIEDHGLQPLLILPKPYSVEQFLGTVEAVLRTSDGNLWDRMLG